MRTIKVSIFPELDGSFFAQPPGWDGCYALGDTVEEVKANLTKAISAYLGEEPESFRLVFEMRKHELRDPPDDEDLRTESYASFDEWLRAMSA